MLPTMESGVDAVAVSPAKAEVPSSQGLDAIVRFTNTDKLHQKLLYLQCIPAASATTDYQENIDVLLPLMEQLGRDEDQPEEVKLEIAVLLPAVGKILHEQLQSSHLQEDAGLDNLLRLIRLAVQLLEDEEERVVQAAQTAIIDIAPWLESGHIGNELLPELDKLMSCPEHEIRSAVTQLYAHLGSAVQSLVEPATIVLGALLPRVLDQAEDMDFQVRREVAIGLAVLGQAMPADTQQDKLLAAYITLCSDRVWAVRKACADILPEMAKLSTAEMRETQLLPVFDRFCGDQSHWVQNSALQQLGPFISTLQAHNIPESLLQRVTTIPDLEVTGDEAAQLRLATAFNFPAVLASAGQEKWPQLRPAHRALMVDRDPAVRRTLACSLHEIAALLGPEKTLEDLGSAIQDLCRDKHADVQEGLVHFFPALLAHLPSTTRSSFFQSLILSLSLDCATWRCRIGLATQLGSLATLEGLQSHILPIAMTLCHDPTAAVRSAVAKQMGRVICELWSFQQPQPASLRLPGFVQDAESEQLAKGISNLSLQQSVDSGQHSQDSEMHAEIIQMIQSLASQDDYQLRQQFVEICLDLAGTCHGLQMSVFQEHFLTTMLTLAQDHVANVRLTLARALSHLSKSILTDLPEVLGTLDSLARDNDPDVANCVTERQSSEIQIIV